MLPDIYYSNCDSYVLKLISEFRRGTVMCRDSNKTDWLYVVKSGACRVLKRLDVVNKETSKQTFQRKQPDISRSWSIPHITHSKFIT